MDNILLLDPVGCFECFWLFSVLIFPTCAVTRGYTVLHWLRSCQRLPADELCLLLPGFLLGLTYLSILGLFSARKTHLGSKADNCGLLWRASVSFISKVLLPRVFFKAYFAKTPSLHEKFFAGVKRDSTSKDRLLLCISALESVLIDLSLA